MDELFKKLYDYIEPFDPDWKTRIKPVSKEMMDSYIRAARLSLGKYAERIPASYLKFLELMGEDDGGLISGRYDIVADMVATNINEVMEWLDVEQKMLPFYIGISMVDHTMWIDLEDEGSKRILERYEDYEEMTRVVSESFEKYLFQCAFDYIVEYGFKKCFSLSERDVGVMAEHQDSTPEKLHKKMLRFIEEYGIRETWFSDPACYIGEGEGIAIGIQYDGGIRCKITSWTEEKLMSFMEGLSERIKEDGYGKEIYAGHRPEHPRNEGAAL